MGSRLWALPLEVRFLGFSLIVLIVGALVIGGWVSSAIRTGVVERTGEVASVYVRSFIGPELQGEPATGPLSPETVDRLDGLLETTALGEGIVSFKIWGRNGTVRYATDTGLIGTTFPAAPDVSAAFRGEVSSHISDLSEEENRFEAMRWTRLLETYAPVRSAVTGETVAVAEFYQRPDELLSKIRDSQQTGWIIVAIATVVMFVLLNGLVRGASRTIRRQTDRLAELADQVRRVSAAKIETDEALLRRVSQDLHDGPAQGLALANLRMSSLEDALAGSAAAADAALVAKAVETSLADVRQISTDLRLPDLRALPLQAILRRAIEQHEARTGERARLHGNGGGYIPAGPAATTIYRVVLEALTNARRHAGPGARTVEYECQSGACRVVVEDDGVGFNPGRTPEGLGLKGMRERAEVLGGRLEVRSRPGAGTRVELVLPEESP